MRRRIEWAVIHQEFREVFVDVGELDSREEAEAWRVARQMTEDRQASAALYTHDAIVQPRHYKVAWREVPVWQFDNPPAETP